MFDQSTSKKRTKNNYDSVVDHLMSMNARMDISKNVNIQSEFIQFNMTKISYCRGETRTLKHTCNPV